MWNRSGTNRPCKIRELIRNYMVHKEKMKNIKPRISATPPKFCPSAPDGDNPHYFQNRLYKERQNKIMYENNLLIRKITSISDGTNSSKPRLTRSQSVTKSLNDVNWKRKRAEITRENSGLLKRITSTRSLYSAKSLDKDYERHKALSRMISQNSSRYLKHNFFVAGSVENSPVKRPATSQERISKRCRSLRSSVQNFWPN